jgi:transaldolase / glucose-6-phosphate isomerase
MPNQRITMHLGKYQPLIAAALAELKNNNILPRIWDHDHTVWKPEPTEIANRLGWLRIAENMLPNVPRMQALANDLQVEGYSNLLLLGMGGSSLAPEVFRKIFSPQVGCLDLAILDTTDPDAVRVLADTLDYSKTIFIVATKSGGTVETLSGFKYFYNQVSDELGVTEVGRHFVAITDPGSKLEQMAQNYNFRDTFLNDPNIGGRYSALSYFGLLPATLVGVDLEKLLNRVTQMAANDSLGGELGAVLAILAKNGRDKVTFITSPEFASFGDWVEQLIAESTGKEGFGILPVVGEPLGPPDVYGADRLFIHLRLGDSAQYDAALLDLEGANHPVIHLQLIDKYDLGGQFFLWELATAVASYFLNINPFDQPNVESAKILAREMVSAYTESGKLPSGETADLTKTTLDEFLADLVPSDYLSIHAYVHPTAEIEKTLQDFRLELRNKYRVATTLGFGPRFLHSTGQLHKGDGGNGIFIQFTADPIADVDIPIEAGSPDTTMTFGTLKNAQALGDGQALLAGNRRFIRFHLGVDVGAGIQSLK